jgi:DNA-binding transcriptional LysR family regulator
MDRLEAMSVFVAVVQTGSLSAASRKLGVPLATVSRRIADLERHLKARLFMRSNREIELTEAGRSFAAACQRILLDVGEAERSVSGEYLTPKGELILSAPIALGRLYLAPVAVDFLGHFPSVDVRLIFADRRLNLIEEHIDIALRVGELHDSSLIVRRVGTVRRIVCASPSYLDKFGAPQHPNDIAAHSCITFENTLSAKEWVFPIDDVETPFPIHSKFVVNTAEAALDAAVQGFGLTRLLDYEVAQELRNGTLQEVMPGYRSPPKPVYLIYEQGTYLPAKARAFLDFAAPRIKQALRSLDKEPGA